jgi:pimeloyl-ACP methyl ester carboxylesterase
MRRLHRVLLLLFGVPLALVVIVPTTCRVAANARETTTRAAAAPASGRFVPGSDVEIFVQEAGPADGAPVLLVHGTGAWSAIWRPTLDTLAAAGYRAIAIDLPPSGFSERPHVPQYDDSSQAKRILAVLDALGAQKVTMVGHSFGASPTVEAVLRTRDRVRLLVLVDAALSPSPPGTAVPRPPSLVRAIVSTPVIRDPLIAATMTNPLLTRWLLQQLIFDPADATDIQTRMVKDQFRVEGTTAALGDWLRQFVLDSTRSLNDDPAQYASLTMPTLVLWGEKDAITPLARGEALLRLLPNGEMVTLPGTGHIPAIEDPDAFHRALLGFLEAHRTE